MKEDREISALFTLIDDPDHEVFDNVCDKIVTYGKGIIPNLEHLWENTTSTEVQERIEMLIHRLHYYDLVKDLTEWRDSAYHDLLLGSLLVAKFQYPDLHTAPVLQDIEKIRRNVWLELNNFLTPLEQATVISSIVYNYYNLKGTEIDYQNPDHFLIHKVLQSKKGNAISNGIVYLILAEMLDIHVKVINIPKQFVLAFFKPNANEEDVQQNPKGTIQFYVDPSSGTAFSHQDLEAYFKRIAVHPTPFYFKPLSHKRIIQLLLEELSKCFDTPNTLYKQEELKQLVELLDL